MPHAPYKHIPVNWFVEKLEAGEPFTFTRYGDGEWLVILGGKYLGRRNSNGCTFTPHLSKELRRVLRNNYSYRHSVLRIARNNVGHEIETFIKKYKIKITWYRGDVLLDKALSGNLFPFINQLRERKILVVGQPFLRQLGPKGFFRPVTFLHPPPKNAIQEKAKIEKGVRDILDNYDIDTILWSSGLHTKVFADDLFPDIGEEITQIDCGSMWDGFMGETSRSYIRRGNVRWQALLDVNTGKRKKIPGESFRK